MTLPLWVVWNPEGGDEGPDDGYKLQAVSAQEAAVRWGQRCESHGCEYTLEETPETVVVCRVDDIRNQRKFRVRAQTSREYFADELP